MHITQTSPEALNQAASILKSGGLVSFPTETVYGLGANALDGKAVAKIFAAKGRPSFNPLIIHVPDLSAAQKYAVFDDRALEIAHAFWPGPLTLILPKRRDGGISDLVTAGLDTIAVRVPAHKTAQELLKTCGLPVAAPSANISGTLSPTTPKHVADSLQNAVDMVLAGGACEIGLESTILDLTGDHPEILRPGAVVAEDFQSRFDFPVVYNVAINEKAPKSPGQLLKHYAPARPVRLRAVDLGGDEALLAFGSLKFMGLKGGGHVKDLPQSRVLNLSESGDLHEAAANLFAMLKALDRPEHSAIAVMDIPDTGLGIAINDRLSRAAQS